MDFREDCEKKIKRFVLENEQMKAEDIYKYIEKRRLLETYINLVELKVKKEHYTSENKGDLHNITHTKRVLANAMVIGSMEGLDFSEMIQLMEAAIYHDIGRINDSEDDFHGELSVKKYMELELDRCNTYKENRTIYMCIEGHSKPDEEFEELANNYEVDDIESAKRVYDALKDADALDRVRFGGLDPYYLRTETAKKMIDFAEELFVEGDLEDHYQEETQPK